MTDKFSLFSHRKSDEISPFAAHRVFPILSSQELLKLNEPHILALKLKQLCQAPSNYYKALYEPVLLNLVDYVQSLPDIRTLNTPMSKQWLIAAMTRTAYAVMLRHRMILPHHAEPKLAAKEYALWTYVIFSSSLLWHIGKLNTHYTVNLCDEAGTVEKTWNPMTQSLYQAGNYYKIAEIDQNGPASFKQMTTVMARHLMPEDGFNWIASNDTALQEWLLALVEETGAQGKVLYILEMAKKLSEQEITCGNIIEELNHYEAILRAYNDKEEAVKALEKLLDGDKDLPPVELVDKSDSKIGEEFLRWLRKGIANKSIAINQKDALVHISPDGVVLAYPELFQDFCSMFYRHKDWIIVYKQFNYLGLTKKSGADTWFGKFYTEKSGRHDTTSSFDGVMVSSKKIFTNGQVPPVNPNLKIMNDPPTETEYPSLTKLARRGLSDKK